jgi:DNA-binding MarR family transcriptional regulator
MADLPEDAISRLEPELAFLVRRLEMNYRKRGYPMERAHYLLLGQLESGEMSTGEIADELGLDHSTVVRQVTAVEELGFAERRPNPRDRRSVLVGLTATGATSLAEMRRMRCTRLGRILADWREDEREGLATLLGRFNVALLEADRAENIVD